MIPSPAEEVSQERPLSAGLLTIFAIPKAFDGHIGVIQRNAIRSWTLLQPRPEVILFGDDPGTAEVAQEFGLRHVPGVARNEFGTPLVSDLFQQAQALAAHDLLVYVNSDIVLLQDFLEAVQQVASSRGRFLMVGRRMDVDITEPLPLEVADWPERLRRLALAQGKLNIARSIDYFVFSHGLYATVPPFAIGRFWWDNWLIWKARSLGAAVVDASSVVLAVHQNHDYGHYPRGKEAMLVGEEAVRNCRMGCEGNLADFEDGLYWKYFWTMDDATHRLTRDGMQPSHRHAWKMFKRTFGHPGSLAKRLGRNLARPFRST